MSKKAASSIDFNENLPFEVEKRNDKKAYDKPAERWLNINFVLRSGDKVKKVPLPFGLILDSLEDRLADGIAKGRLNDREIKEQEFLLKLLDRAFDSISPGSSMSVELEGRLNKPSSSKEEVELDEDEWSL